MPFIPQENDLCVNSFRQNIHPCVLHCTHLDVRPGVLPDLLDLAALLADDAAHDGLVDQQPQLPRPAVILLNAET